MTKSGSQVCKLHMKTQTYSELKKFWDPWKWA